jgi:MoxR-like ATPase
MFNVVLTYPKYEEELQVIKNTTGNMNVTLKPVISAAEILAFQQLVRKVPVADNVLEYAVKLVSKTRPNSANATTKVNEYIGFGAGPRAGQFLILGAKVHALLNGSYSPDIDDVKAVAKDVLRHRLIKNYKAEAEGISVEEIIESLL